MKKTKVFQRNENDCGTAAIATLLNITYESGPNTDNGLDVNYIIYANGVVKITDSSIDEWMHKNKIKWGKGKIGKFICPWKYYLGLLMNGNGCHAVVMRGNKIWHDPLIDTQFTDKDVKYSFSIKV